MENGLEAKMEQLMRAYGDALLRMCYLYLKDRALAEDAVQDTFIKAYKRLHTFAGTSSEKTWLMRIAINTCKDYCRSPYLRMRQKALPLEGAPEIGIQMEASEDTVLEAVMALPDKYKQVVLLFYYQQMKLREIAQALRIPVPTVSSRLKRAKGLLKDELREWYDEA